MSARDFPFRPPPLELGAPLRWVLARALGPSAPGLSPGPAAEAADLALRLGLAARILARGEGATLASELGAAALERLLDERRALAARQLRSEAALAEFTAVAGALGIPWALLKGQALVLGGWAPPSARPAGDVDLLVPRDAVQPLHRELLRRGFRATGDEHEHQAPALLHPHGGLVELHRVILGVRLAGRRSADFAELDRTGLIEQRSLVGATTPRPMPVREVLAAHALVHTLAQHALAPGAYSGLLMVADLVDLGVASTVEARTVARLRPWLRKAVPPRLLEAALALAASLRDGELPPPTEDAGRLLAHFVAGLTDAGYARSLKTRLLERPLSDRGPTAARLVLLARTLAPPRRHTAEGGREAWWRWGLRLTGRPFDLARRWRSARRSGAGPRGESEPP